MLQNGAERDRKYRSTSPERVRGFQPNETRVTHLRSAVKECLVISYCMTKNYGQRSFSWPNTLELIYRHFTLTLRDKSMPLSQFCSRLKTEIFCRACNRSQRHRDSLYIHRAYSYTKRWVLLTFWVVKTSQHGQKSVSIFSKITCYCNAR